MVGGGCRWVVVGGGCWVVGEQWCVVVVEDCLHHIYNKQWQSARKMTVHRNAQHASHLTPSAVYRHTKPSVKPTRVATARIRRTCSGQQQQQQNNNKRTSDMLDPQLRLAPRGSAHGRSPLSMKNCLARVLFSCMASWTGADFSFVGGASWTLGVRRIAYPGVSVRSWFRGQGAGLLSWTIASRRG